MIRYFAAHPTAGNLMMIVFVLTGLLTVNSLRRETLPSIAPRNVLVSVSYPGARAEDVEEAICRRVENAVESVEYIAKISCEAKDSLAQATIQMEEGEDLDRFLAKVKTQIDAVDDFPEKAKDPTVEAIGTTNFAASVALTGFENRSYLKAYALQLKDRMLQWGRISQVEIKGFSEHQIRIELKNAALRQYGLSIASVAQKIYDQSIDLPGGTIEAVDGTISLRFADERKKVREFRDLILVSNENGGIIRLGDVATISDRFSLDEDKTLFNGQPAALLEIYTTSKEDMLKVVDAVKALIEKEQEIAPPGIKITLSNDNSSVVRERLNLLVENGLQGLVLVFLVMWLFFGFRYSFWVTMGLPVSFLGALSIMYVMDFSLNMMSMLGLLIASGLLMDDAIVISENIAAHRDKGKSPLVAAVDGATQVFPSIFSSFLTTAMVLGSLIFLSGDTGQVLKAVPIVMLFVLTVSLVEAFLILPHHLLHTLKKSDGGKPGIQKYVNKILTGFSNKIVGPIIDFCMAWRYFTVGIAVALLMVAISMLASGILKFSVFPDLDGDIVEARILLPQGTPLAKTKLVVSKVQASLERLNKDLSQKQPAGQSFVKNVTVQFNKNTDSHETGSHIATIAVDILAANIRSITSDAFIELWRREVGQIPDVLGIKFTETVIGPGGLAIEMRLSGPDLSRLKIASLELQGWLEQYEGVINLMDDLRPGKKELRIRMSEQAAILGITARDIANQLRASFYGTIVSEIQVGPESYEIDVRMDLNDRNSTADLDNFSIATVDGSLVPLKAVAQITHERGYARINRYNRVRTITVQGDVDRMIANANDIVSDTQKRFFPVLKKKYPDIKVGLGGQNEEGTKTRNSMNTGFVLGLIGVFIMLSFQFKSYIEPIVVMIIIPLSFVGVIFGHIALGIDFTMPSMLGFVAMAGVAVNNSILLVNFIKDHHEDYASIAIAAPKAARARFRAILITTLTTIAGMLPLLTETSMQAQVLIPTVASLTFGLSTSVIMVLFVVPAVYAILDDFGLSTVTAVDNVRNVTTS